MRSGFSIKILCENGGLQFQQYIIIKFQISEQSYVHIYILC